MKSGGQPPNLFYKLSRVLHLIRKLRPERETKTKTIKKTQTHRPKPKQTNKKIHKQNVTPGIKEKGRERKKEGREKKQPLLPKQEQILYLKMGKQAEKGGRERGERYRGSGDVSVCVYVRERERGTERGRERERERARAKYQRLCKISLER